MNTNRNEKLLEMVNSFCIDPILNVDLVRRSENTWSLLDGSLCLNKQTNEWDFERNPSERDEEYLSLHRFNSIDEAITFYLNWRKNYYFICFKAKNYRWRKVLYQSNAISVREYWDSFAEEKEGIQSRKGLWVLIGKDFQVIEEYRSPDPSSQGVEFYDAIGNLYS